MSAIGKPYADISFELQRNDTYQETYLIEEEGDDGVATPLNLTGSVLEMDVCRVAGDGTPVLEIDEEISSTVTGIKVADQTTNPGEFMLTLIGGELGAIGGPKEVVRLAMDLKVTLPNGLNFVYARGVLTLTPGVTL